MNTNIINNDETDNANETVVAAAAVIITKMMKPLSSHTIPKMGGRGTNVTANVNANVNVTNELEIPKFVKPYPERKVSGLTNYEDVVVPSASASASASANINNFHNSSPNMSGSTNFSGTEFSEAIALSEQETNTASSSSITFSAQANLPPLPIPTLNDTMSKFLEHLEALQADDHPEERDKTKRLVDDFLKPNANVSVNVNNEEGATPATPATTTTTTTTGPQLQRLLLEYDRSGRESGLIGSYVEEFWNDAYLAPDSSVVLNLNPYFVLESSPDPKLSGNQIRRAASLCFASVKMASQLRNENLKPDTFKGKPLCMGKCT
jgi:hypothetical protein